MKKIRMLGLAVFQADVKPEKTRTFRRAEMSTLVEYEFPALTAADLASDAVRVMPFDERAALGRAYAAPPASRSYAGWEGALWRPMAGRQNDPLTCEDYQAGLRLAPTFANRHGLDPLASVRLTPHSSVSSIHEGFSLLDENTFVGEIAWSNKADAVAAHIEAASLLIAVDGAMWRRHPGPSWQVEPPSSTSVPKRGKVLLDDDLYIHQIGETFRVDRLTPAEEMSRRRWGEATVFGEVERFDARFGARDDLSQGFRTLLDGLAEDGRKFVPHLDPAAVAAYVELHRLIKTRSPMAPFSTIDADAVAARISLLDEALSARTLPYHLHDHARNLRKGIRAAKERIALEHVPAPDAEEEAAIARLAMP